jgi:hypothetical protein
MEEHAGRACMCRELQLLQLEALELGGLYSVSSAQPAQAGGFHVVQASVNALTIAAPLCQLSLMFQDAQFRWCACSHSMAACCQAANRIHLGCTYEVAGPHPRLHGGDGLELNSIWHPLHSYMSAGLQGSVLNCRKHASEQPDRW